MSTTDNPYSPPSAVVADFLPAGGDAVFAVPAARLSAGRGVSWISEGWALFKAAPGMWIVALLILFGIQMALALIPILGSLVSIVIGPFFMAGLLAFAHGIARGEAADLGKLFIGLKQKTGALVAVALIYFLMVIALIVAFMAVGFFMLGGLSALTEGNMDGLINAFMNGGGLAGLLILALAFVAVMTLVAAAYWYAPGLVLYTDLGAGAALKESFRACLSNWLAFLVYGFLGLLLLVLGLITFGLGLLVVLPVMMASYYASFRDLFGQKA